MITKLAFCLILLGCRSASFGDTSPDDSYELYSSIYKDTQTLEANEVVGIAETALAIPFLECLKPVTDEERRMAAAARASGNDQMKWERRFDLGHTYRLIPSAETDKAIDCIQEHAHEKDKPGCDAYAKMRYVRFFSVPVFNQDHTKALIAISRSCGELCGNGSLQVYRKTRAGWERESDGFAKCVWEA